MTSIVHRWQAVHRYRQWAILASAAMTIALIGLVVAGRTVNAMNPAVVLLLLTLLVSTSFGARAGLVSAVLSNLTLRYFFLEPIYDLWANDVELGMTLGVFLLAAMLAGTLLEPRPGETEQGWQQAKQGLAAPASPTLIVDTDRHIVTLEGQEVSLTPTEFKLLSYMSQNPGRVLRHQSILDAVWGADYGADSSIVRTYVKQLRAKLHDDPSKPQFIRTESRVGYRFLETPKAETSIPQAS